MRVDLYLQDGTKKGNVELNTEVFEVKPNKELISRLLVLQQANRRQSIAHAKSRGEVVCSRRKIYRQKGTGGARHGAKSANLFRGGGVTFGPRSNRNFTKRMNRKERRQALFGALSIKAAQGEIVALEVNLEEKAKTKQLKGVLEKMPSSKSFLVVVPEKNKAIQKSIANLEFAKALLVDYLNVEDILKYERVVFLKSALQKVEEVFLKKN
ncbi:MAG TPA: 50S ribosomal protein L4 [Candidatus Peregrinibacteria bacterium]|nr:50S ribosomal protein L4 [Candidatus Peregrinibacteria bacterium]